MLQYFANCPLLSDMIDSAQSYCATPLLNAMNYSCSAETGYITACDEGGQTSLVVNSTLCSSNPLVAGTFFCKYQDILNVLLQFQ